MIEVVKAPPFATIQDLGWRTGRAVGLPTGGAMHPELLQAANQLIGNPGGLAGLEWALGPGLLRFLHDTQVCVTRDAEVRIGDAVQRSGVVSVGAGAPLQIIPRGRDRFIYVAVKGGLDVPQVMGSRSTYLPGGFGGLEGRRLRNGDRLQTGAAIKQRHSTAASRAEPSGIAQADLMLRATRGPQWELFGPKAREVFFAGVYTVTPASDRMGYRLKGPAVHPGSRATLPSEAACPGAVQIPDGGEPIVLMPDGPTVGGYPKLAVIVPADLGELAQCQPGRTVRFREVSLDEARSLRR